MPFDIPDEDWKEIKKIVEETKGQVTYLGPSPAPKTKSSTFITFRKKEVKK